NSSNLVSHSWPSHESWFHIPDSSRLRLSLALMKDRLFVCVMTLLIVGTGVGFAQTPAARPVSARADDTRYTPPRTPWGDPDLQGLWPGTEMVGVPLQRPREFGTRNVLTEAEFQARVQQAQRQQEIDTADFDLETADTTNAGEVGSATSPPPHWLERGRPSHQASLIVDPPDGRQPALVPEAQK